MEKRDEKEGEEEGIIQVEDIVLNILYTFPYKTQLRFSSVSKSWLDMITNPTRPDSCHSVLVKFYNRYYTSPDTVLGFLYPDLITYRLNWAPLSTPGPKNDPPPPSFPKSSLSLLNQRPIMLKAVSNGCLLCQRYQQPDSTDTKLDLPTLHYYSVLNPLTGDEVDLPPVLKQFDSESVVGFDCSPSSSKQNDNDIIHFTVIIIDNGSSRYRPILEVKLFATNQNQSTQNGWSEFTLKMIWPVKNLFLVPYLERSYSIGSSPGVALKGVTGNLEFFWLCQDDNYVLRWDQTKPSFGYIELPHDRHCHCHSFIDEGGYNYNYNYNYGALLAFEQQQLYYGIQCQKMKTIQVFAYVYRPLDKNYTWDPWELCYEVCLRDVEDECRRKMKLGCSGSSSNDNQNNHNNWKNSSLLYKGFHPKNPYVLFLIFQHKLVSYDVKSRELVVHHDNDTQRVSVSADATEEMNRHWIPCLRWPWPRTLPCIPKDYY